MENGTVTTSASESVISTQAQHTPGPWHCDFTRYDYGGWQQPSCFAKITHGETVVAFYETRYVEYPSDEECAANARLIAVAPELLAALRQCRAELDVLRNGSLGGVPNAIVALIPEAIEAADAAIAKATGAP